MFYDLKNNAEKLQWTKSDLDKLRSMDADGFYDRPPRCPIGSAILTVALYLSEASEGLIVNTTQNTISDIQLPQPAENVSVIVLAEPKFEGSKSDGWGQGADRIDHSPSSIPGIFVPLCLLMLPVFTRVEYSSARFRRFGFAIWDRKRMFAFGLANGPGPSEIVAPNRRELLFKYLTLSE